MKKKKKIDVRVDKECVFDLDSNSPNSKIARIINIVFLLYALFCFVWLCLSATFFTIDRSGFWKLDFEPYQASQFVVFCLGVFELLSGRSLGYGPYKLVVMSPGYISRTIAFLIIAVANLFLPKNKRIYNGRSRFDNSVNEVK